MNQQSSTSLSQPGRTSYSSFFHKIMPVRQASGRAIWSSCGRVSASWRRPESGRETLRGCGRGSGGASGCGTGCAGGSLCTRQTLSACCMDSILLLCDVRLLPPGTFRIQVWKPHFSKEIVLFHQRSPLFSPSEKNVASRPVNERSKEGEARGLTLIPGRVSNMNSQGANFTSQVGIGFRV